MEALVGPSFWTLVAALAAAAVYGAAHGFSPGHGKSMMAAYLVGREGRPRDALILGLSVTVAHMGGVLALGAIMAVALGLGTADEPVLWWLRTLSGAAVLLIGTILLVARVRGSHRGIADAHPHGHHHPHAHPHPHHESQPKGAGDDADAAPSSGGSPIRRGLPVWQTIGLGFAGGAVPCPTALAMVGIGASLGRPLATLTLVFAFSLGLAVSLVLLGLGIVRGSRWLERLGIGRRAIRVAGIVGAVVLVLVGIALTIAPTVDHGWLGRGTLHAPARISHRSAACLLRCS